MNVEHMDRMPTVAAVMTPFPHSIEIDQLLQRARQVMRRHRFHHLPVMEGGRLVGLLSADQAEKAGEGWRVRDVCALDPCIVATTEPLDAVLATMTGGVETVLVVKSGHLAGIFTLKDACRRFAELLREMFPKQGGDEAA